MLIVLSPAKSLDFKEAPIVEEHTFPQFDTEAAELIQLLKDYSVEELMELMSISDKLAVLNHGRFKTWLQNPPLDFARQAICAFNGDVYTGLNVKDWDKKQFSFAQQHIRILSGLYGVLRPLDYISEYRLEMGSKLKNPNGENLYSFWDNKITEHLNLQLKSIKSDVLVNLASNEYFKSVQKKTLDAKVITPVFKDFKNDKYKIVSFFAKKARGMMSRYVVKNGITQVDDLKGFTDGGYYFNEPLSKGNEWVFTRD